MVEDDASGGASADDLALPPRLASVKAEPLGEGTIHLHFSVIAATLNDIGSGAVEAKHLDAILRPFSSAIIALADRLQLMEERATREQRLRANTTADAALTKLRRRLVGVHFSAWCEVVKRREVALDAMLTQHAARSPGNVHCRAVFGRWRQGVLAMKREREELSKRSLHRLRSRELHTCFCEWRDLVLEARQEAMSSEEKEAERDWVRSFVRSTLTGMPTESSASGPTPDRQAGGVTGWRDGLEEQMESQQAALQSLVLAVGELPVEVHRLCNLYVDIAIKIVARNIKLGWTNL